MKDPLISFEERYPFIYDIEVKGVPIYDELRDEIYAILKGVNTPTGQGTNVKKGRIYLGRILDSFIGLRTNREKKTLIFTSSVYRRDKGRNLSAEYLIERYPAAVVFEWPSRNAEFDCAYFRDSKKDCYCPLDGYVLIQKIYNTIRKGKRVKLEEKTKLKLASLFFNAAPPRDIYEKKAIDAIIAHLPTSYAQTVLNHDIFKWLFRRYKNVAYAIDFWGSGRENIFPVLQGNPEKIELQHGIITAFHPGYIYPAFVGRVQSDFFKRKLLVYGEATKKLLTEHSIFRNSQIEVIGNPRIEMYKRLDGGEIHENRYILFTSQPFEQDGTGECYYDSVLPVLKRISNLLLSDAKWSQYELAVKLHPRENEAVAEKYKNGLGKARIFQSGAELYDLLKQTYIHLTVSSTVLFEAAEFAAPTAIIRYNGITDTENYGFSVKMMDENSAVDVLEDIAAGYSAYTAYLMDQACKYM